MWQGWKESMEHPLNYVAGMEEKYGTSVVGY